MDALPLLVAALVPDACCPQAAPSGLPDAASYARASKPLNASTAVIIDASGAAHHLAAGIDLMELDAFASALWAHTVDEAVQLAAVRTVVLVFADAARSPATPMRRRRFSAATRDVVARSRFAQKYTGSSAKPDDCRQLYDAILAFIVGGYASTGGAHVIVHGLTPAPMCLAPDVDNVVDGATVWQEAAATPGLVLPAGIDAPADTDTAIVAWTRALAVQPTLVIADDPAVLAALMVHSALTATTTVPRSVLMLARPRGIAVPVCTDAVTPGPGRRPVHMPACYLAQYINMHAAVTAINVILAPALVPDVVGHRNHGVLALLLLALCHSHDFAPVAWFAHNSGIGTALTELVVAGRARRMGHLLTCNEATGAVSVRVAGLEQLTAAIEHDANVPPRPSSACNAQAARLSLWLARLTQASLCLDWAQPDPRAVNANSGRSVWGYGTDGSFTANVDMRLVHTCGGAPDGL